MSTCSTIGAHLRPGNGCFDVYRTETGRPIGEIHPSEAHGYSAWYLATHGSDVLEACGEYTHLCRAIQEVRDRHFQSMSAYRRGSAA